MDKILRLKHLKLTIVSERTLIPMGMFVAFLNLVAFTTMFFVFGIDGEFLQNPNIKHFSSMLLIMFAMLFCLFFLIICWIKKSMNHKIPNDDIEENLLATLSVLFSPEIVENRMQFLAKTCEGHFNIRKEFQAILPSNEDCWSPNDISALKNKATDIEEARDAFYCARDNFDFMGFYVYEKVSHYTDPGNYKNLMSLREQRESLEA